MERERNEKYTSKHLFCDQQEEGTIREMFNGMLQLVPGEMHVAGPGVEEVLAMAAFTMKEEALGADVVMRDGTVLWQLVLYVVGSVSGKSQ